MIWMVLAAVLIVVSATAEDANNATVTEIYMPGVNETLQIGLASNPSTGYSWNASYDPSALRLENPEGQLFPAERQLAGSGSWQVFYFEVLKAGMHNITMSYYRPWENQSTAVDTRLYEVKVAEENTTSTEVVQGENSQITTIFYADQGEGFQITSSIDAVRGEDFEIETTENPSTGFTWNATFDTSALTLVNSTYRPNVDCELYNCSGMVGIGGMRTFTFRPLEAGMTNLTLRLARSGGETARVWKFEVNVA
jgi:predicted secreted protein